MGEGSTFEVNCSFMYIKVFKKETRGQDRKTGHIKLTFRHVQHQRGQGFKQGMVEGGVGGVGTHAGEQDTTVNNTRCQQEIAVKNNPKKNVIDNLIQ